MKINLPQLLTLKVLLVCMSSTQLNAQIFAPDRNWADTTKYTVIDEGFTQDSIFIFFDDNEPWLMAEFSHGSEANYQWYRYNENVNNSSLPFLGRFNQIPGETDATLTSIGTGGYMVEVERISDGTLETYICWVMVDNVELISLDLFSNTCNELKFYLYSLPLITEVDFLFSYFDIHSNVHHEISVLSNNYFEDLEVTPTPSHSDLTVLKDFPIITIYHMGGIDPWGFEIRYGPYEDNAFKYTLTAARPFGRGEVSLESDQIPTVATMADMEIAFLIREEWVTQEINPQNIPEGEALLEIQLISNSQNADSVFWNIINDEYRFRRGGDSILWETSMPFTENEVYPTKRKMIPGVYDIEHVSSKRTNGLLCRDTIIQRIEVVPSLLDPESIPNVFSPGAGSINNRFIIKGLDPDSPPTDAVDEYVMSIKSFKITIVNRAGKQVYTFSGDPKKWEGWNGKIDGTKGDAPTGVYYYVIEAVGWDGRRYRGRNYTGFLHLYR